LDYNTELWLSKQVTTCYDFGLAPIQSTTSWWANFALQTDRW